MRALEFITEQQNESLEDITREFVSNYKQDPVGMFMHAKSSYLDAVGRAKNISMKAALLYRSHQDMSKQEFQDTVMKHFGAHLKKHGFPRHASEGWGAAEKDLMKSLTQNVTEDVKMKAKEILSEAEHSSEIKQILLDKGYVFLGKGVDQMAFAEPGSNNTVLKIFGTSERAQPGELTDKQKSFKTFYDAIKADPTNEFLPEIYGYNLFNFKGKPYLQIRMERLFPFENGAEGWNLLLDKMSVKVEFGTTVEEYLNGLENSIENSILNNDALVTLIMHLGTEGLTKMYETIQHLYKIANKNGYALDLHMGNFMLDSDGNPVIVDPYILWD